MMKQSLIQQIKEAIEAIAEIGLGHEDITSGADIALEGMTNKELREILSQLHTRKRQQPLEEAEAEPKRPVQTKWF